MCVCLYRFLTPPCTHLGLFVPTYAIKADMLETAKTSFTATYFVLSQFPSQALTVREKILNLATFIHRLQRRYTHSSILCATTFPLNYVPTQTLSESPKNHFQECRLKGTRSGDSVWYCGKYLINVGCMGEQSR